MPRGASLTAAGANADDWGDGKVNFRTPFLVGDDIDSTGESWRDGSTPPKEPEPPLAKWGEASRPSTPDMGKFRTLNLRGRAETICRSWCTEGYGAPSSVGLFYVFKTALYAVMGWYVCAAWLPQTELTVWSGDAYKRFVLFTILWEVLGIGCSAGPLNGRYLPSPVVAPVYFLRPGAVKIPPQWAAASLPNWVVGGSERGWLDVGLYAALVVALAAPLRAAPGMVGVDAFILVGALHVVIGLRDLTVFWAARSDHFLWLVAFMATDEEWLAGCQLVQVCIWFFAGLSKIGPWFPYVVMAMISNSHPASV